MISRPLSRYTRLLGATILLATAADAYAQDFEARSMDADGNGSISSAEAERAAAAMFKTMDKNADGMLSQSEFVDAHLARLQQMDSNHDGEVSKAERREQVRKLLGR